MKTRAGSAGDDDEQADDQYPQAQFCQAFLGFFRLHRQQERPAGNLDIQIADPGRGENRRVGLDIVIRGDYVWKKIVVTTPAVGVEVSKGYERI